MQAEGGIPFADGQLKDGVAVVTGGGTGIGLAVARLLVKLGAHVAICGRRQAVLEDAGQELIALAGGDSSRVMSRVCDIRSPQQIDSFVEAVIAAFGPVTILINNAGGQFPSPALSISPNGFEAVVRNNLLGTFNMTRAVASKCMVPQERGCVVNVIAQIARGFPGMAHTGAARAGVDNLTKSLAVEWCKSHVRVNAVAPGFIQSSGTDQYPPDLVRLALQATPVGRLGTVDEVAALIVYLVLPISDFITGQTFYIDGGQALHGDIWGAKL